MPREAGDLLLSFSCLEETGPLVCGPPRMQPLPSPMGAARRRAQLSQLAGSALLHPELCLLRFLGSAPSSGLWRRESVSAQKPALLSGFLLTSAGPLPSSPHPLPFASWLPLSWRPPICPQVPQSRGGTCSDDRITLCIVSALWALVKGPLKNLKCGENTFFLFKPQKRP